MATDDQIALAAAQSAAASATTAAAAARAAVAAVVDPEATQGPDPTLLPFAPDSPWRLGVAETVEFADEDDPRNATMHDNGNPGEGLAFVNYDQFSHPVNFAENTDPLASMTDDWHTPDVIPPGGTWQERIPAGARIAPGSDAHMHVITPDRRSVIEHWAVTKHSNISFNTLRRHVVDLRGSGIGPQNGTRAYGGSAIGGLIRVWEVDPDHPAYTGVISHPLAIALRQNQLWKSGVVDPGWSDNSPYKLDGYGRDRGYVWPATEQDIGTTYSGTIPMGSYFAIPGDVDLESLGLAGEEAMMVARAAQDYGVYVTDTGSAAAFYLEDEAQQNDNVVAWYTNLLHGDWEWSASNIHKIIDALRVVTNNTAKTPNGGPLGAARRGTGYALASDVAGLAQDVSANVIEGPKTIPALGRRLWKSGADQVVPCFAEVNVALGSSSYSVGDGMDSTVTTVTGGGIPSLAAPRNAIRVDELGLYLVDACVSFIGGAPGDRSLLIRIGTDLPGSYRGFGNNGTADDISTAGSCVMRLAPGDVVSLAVYCTGGDDVTIQTGESATWLAVTMLAAG